MSTEVRRAIVHYSNDTTGAVRVKIPGITGEKAVPVNPQGLSYSGGTWSVPSPGDVVMVAVEDNSDVYWVSGYPSGLSTSEVNALIAAYVDPLEESLEGYIDGLAKPSTWTDVTFQNSWVNYASGYQTVQYRKIGDIVYVRGACKDGSLSTVIFTLPTGFRPPASLTIMQWSLGSIIATFNVDASSGEVEIGSQGGTGYVTTNFSFSVTT